MHSKLFETALGISNPWFMNGIDFVVGSRFPYPEIAGGYPLHDTVVKRYRHLNFFQHDLLSRSAHASAHASHQAA